RRVVDQEPHGAVAYCPDMSIRHLEWTSAMTYWRKMYVYGQSLQRYRGLAGAEPLTMVERVKVFRQTVRAKGYRAWEVLALAAGLVCGLIAWEAGQVVGGYRRPSGADGGTAQGPSS